MNKKLVKGIAAATIGTVVVAGIKIIQKVRDEKGTSLKAKTRLIKEETELMKKDTERLRETKQRREDIMESLRNKMIELGVKEEIESTEDLEGLDEKTIIDIKIALEIAKRELDETDRIFEEIEMKQKKRYEFLEKIKQD